MHFDIPFCDKNNERKMLASRVKQIIDHIGDRIFTDCDDAGDFMFREGQYSPDKIDEGEWVPFGKDDMWGYREEYCWFKQTVRIPERFAGKSVVYEVTPFPDGSWRTPQQQFIFFVNGKMVQGGDSHHTYIYLAEHAKGGETFDIALNAYCDDWEFRGKSALRAYLKVKDMETNALYYDLLTPWNVAHCYTHEDEARIDIIKTLNTAVNMLELNTADDDVYRESVRNVRNYLKENIYGRSSDVLTSAIGHTHIDTAWLWRLRQTREKAARSFMTVVNLMKEYPEYKFMSSQAQLYDFVKQDYPELYEQIKQMVKEKRWEPEGSMWVESDTNVVSGESLVRQFLVGKRFFRDEFGVDNKIMWLPDVFGYSGALPQIIKKADIDYFMTTKISWNEFNKFPFDTFMWRGIDGTEVLSHFIPTENADDTEFMTTYNGKLTPTQVIGGWKRYSNKDLNKNVLFSFGHGDGGGGVDRDMLEEGKRMSRGIDGCPMVRQEFARDFFDRLKKEVEGSDRLPVWSGELYLEFHRGTLTAQARNKKYNRKSEYLYQDAETLGVLAKTLAGKEYESQKILDGWKIILLNQFHDIIPGSSIAQVYEDSKEQYEQIGAAGREMVSDSEKAIAECVATDGDSIVVFNTLGFDRNSVVITDMPEKADFHLIDSDENSVPWQKTYDGKLCFVAESVPAKGYKTYKIADGIEEIDGGMEIDGDTFENDFYSVTFDENKNISSYICFDAERNVAKEGQTIGRLIAYEDRAHNHEAWDIKCYYGEKFWNIDDVENAEIIENGAVRTVYKIDRRFNLSHISQYYIFYPDFERIDIFYDIDWKEKRIALKADYPVDVNATEATFDIQFGNIKRTAHENTTWDYAQFESCGHKWADLSDNGFGFSVLNDCKYGWTVKNGHIKPTLLRSATAPNHNQDRERHTFTYALYAHAGDVSASDVVSEGYDLNVPLTAVHTGAHKGTLEPDFSLVSVDADNVIIETVKKAEDSDDIIIRMYETWNCGTDADVSFGLPVTAVSECNLLEEKDEPLALSDNKVVLKFRPFEIKTIKVALK